jgi:signal peptidase
MNQPSSTLRDARRWTLRALTWTAIALSAWFLWPVRFGGDTSIVVVQGKSMIPTYYTGDLVVARRQDHYAIGEIVVFKVARPGSDHRAALVVHRLINVGPDGRITTRGDNRAAPDAFNLTTADIVGRAVTRVRYGGLLLFLLSRWWMLAILSGLITVAYLWPQVPAPASANKEDHHRLTASVES